MIDRKQVMADLERICREVFRNPDIELTEETTAPDVDGWDSLSHVRLIFHVEKHFKITVGVKEASRMRNIGELASVIERKVQA
jgi:acyl carrier protein